MVHFIKDRKFKTPPFVFGPSVFCYFKNLLKKVAHTL